MKKQGIIPCIVVHILMIVLIGLILTPGLRPVKTVSAFLGTVGLIEVFYLFQMYRAKKNGTSQKAPSDILTIVWCFLILWEVVTTQKNMVHPVLFPTPEDVFYVFPTQYKVLLENVVASMELLFFGIVIGLVLAVVLGVFVGWIPRLSDIFYPIANVITPIPPVVYAPYIIILMPTFRSASAVIVIVGIFFPTFLRMILRMKSIDARILESAKVMNVSNVTMVTQILFPYVMPEVVSGLRITVTTSVMLLIFAEMMGATRGMGYYIVNYNTYANYTNVVAGVIVVGIVITILGALVSVIQKNTVKW